MVTAAPKRSQPSPRTNAQTISQTQVIDANDENAHIYRFLAGRLDQIIHSAIVCGGKRTSPKEWLRQERSFDMIYIGFGAARSRVYSAELHTISLITPVTSRVVRASASALDLSYSWRT